MNAALRLLALLLWSALALTGIASAQDGGRWFEREALNPGLGLSPDRIERSTPRATVESLFRAAQNNDWEAAAHLLDLSAIPPGLQAETGAEIAEKLKIVIDRKVVLDWSQIVDRPDGFDASESSRAATAGMDRRALLLWELTIGEIPATVQLVRIKPADSDPVWVFSERTVAKVTPLFEEYGPSEFEEWLPRWSRKEVAYGIMRWEFIGLPLLISLALGVGLLLRSMIRRARLGVDSPVVRGVIKAAGTPVMIAAATAVIWAGMSTVFVFSGRLDVFLSPLVAVGFVAAALMLIVNTIEAALDRLVGFDDTTDLTTRQAAQHRELATKLIAARRILVIFVFVLGAGIVLSTADVFQSLGFSILASAGALTLILGFAARKILGNILASLQIALNQSAKVGDRVVYKDHLCHVERINFTYVQLRDWDGTRLIVPVEEFVNETFENWTVTDPAMLRILKFKLDPQADLGALRDAFKEVIESLDPEELDADPVEKGKVRVTGQDVFGIDVWFYVPCADPNTSWDMACEAREELVKRMNKMEFKDGRSIFPRAAAAEAA